MRKAVVDVGSNSVLLLVEEQKENGWDQVFESTAVTSLGEGTKKTGLLGELGISRTLEALQEAFKKADSLGCESTVAAVTMAGRIASNTAEFQRRAALQNTPVTVLSGDQEAELGFRATVLNTQFSSMESVSIIDVGGQSTELVSANRDGENWRVWFKRSFPIGTLALRGELLASECPSPPEILSAMADIDDCIGLCYRRQVAGNAIALGATATNLVSIRDGLERWQPELVHGAWLDFGEVSGAVGTLMPMTELERSQLIGIEKGREGTLPAGALILERFLNAIGAPGCYVSTRGWRHALLEGGLPPEVNL